MVKSENVWTAIEELDEMGISDTDKFESLAGWIGQQEVKEWIEGRVELDYDVTFDDDGNMKFDRDDD